MARAHYIVLCLADGQIVEATSRVFEDYTEVVEYAKTVHPSRKPTILLVAVLSTGEVFTSLTDWSHDN